MDVDARTGAGSVTSGDRADGGTPQVLLAETRRVLDAQSRLVQRQRAQATNVVRILLTACGLVLTLASIAVSTGVPSGVSTGALASTLASTLVGALGTAGSVSPTAGTVARTVGVALFGVLAGLALLACRILCAALAVLDPQAGEQAVVRLLTTPVRADARPAAETFRPPDADAVRTHPTLRSGLDADATAALSASPDPVRAVVDYNAGCVAGNALLVERNRWYLTRVYRSAVVGVALLTTALVVLLGVTMAAVG